MIETTSLELSKRLELILKRFIKRPYFAHNSSQGFGELTYDVSPFFINSEGYVAPAYTACELMKVLPKTVNGGKLTLWAERGMWDVDYFDDEIEVAPLQNWFAPMQDNPAEALGLMVCWLDKEGFLNGGC